MYHWYVFIRSTNEYYKTNRVQEVSELVRKYPKNVLICNMTKPFEKRLALTLIVRIKRGE